MSQGRPAKDVSLGVTYRTIWGRPGDVRTFFWDVLRMSLGRNFAVRVINWELEKFSWNTICTKLCLTSASSVGLKRKRFILIWWRKWWKLYLGCFNRRSNVISNVSKIFVKSIRYLLWFSYTSIIIKSCTWSCVLEIIWTS